MQNVDVCITLLISTEVQNCSTFQKEALRSFFCAKGQKMHRLQLLSAISPYGAVFAEIT